MVEKDGTRSHHRKVGQVAFYSGITPLQFIFRTSKKKLYIKNGQNMTFCFFKLGTIIKKVRNTHCKGVIPEYNATCRKIP